MVPLVDLSVVNTAEIRDAVAERWEVIIDEQSFVDGPEVTEFEEAWAAYVGARYCVGVGNGTDALELAVRGLYGRERLAGLAVPALTFVATAEAVVRAGETVMLADVDDQLLARQSGGVGVGLYGQHPGDAAAILDAAHMHGHKTGGRLAAWSFYPTKNLGAWGDGGAVTTDDEGLADEIRELARHGYNGATGCGFNSRLDTLQAAVLLEKLPFLDGWAMDRRAAATDYATRLIEHGLEPIGADGDGHHVWHQVVVRVPHRAGVLRGMLDRHISCGVHYPLALSQMPWLDPFLMKERYECPVAERAAAEVLSLPLWPGMESAVVERVVEALVESIEEARCVI